MKRWVMCSAIPGSDWEGPPEGHIKPKRKYLWGTGTQSKLLHAADSHPNNCTGGKPNPGQMFHLHSRHSSSFHLQVHEKNFRFLWAIVFHIQFLFSLSFSYTCIYIYVYVQMYIWRHIYTWLHILVINFPLIDINKSSSRHGYSFVAFHYNSEFPFVPCIFFSSLFLCSRFLQVLLRAQLYR